jgi:hypothetical protein
MKYCYNCQVYRPDDFAFCIKCGASFDVKYCRRLHPNPATADYCRVCGSPDLSNPHTRPRLGMTAAVSLFVIATGVAGTALFLVISSLAQYTSISAWKILCLTAIAACGFVAWKAIKTP